MRVDLGKESMEWSMFRDYWKMLQDIWETEDTDEYWKAVVEKTEEFQQKHSSQFARDLSLALVHELERKYKIGRN